MIPLSIIISFDRSEPDDNPAPSEDHFVYANSTATDNSTSNVNSTEKVDNSSSSGQPFKYHQTIERRSSREPGEDTAASHIPPPVIDEQAERDRKLEAHSFGFKVTVYRTPGHKGKFKHSAIDSAHVTEDLFRQWDKILVSIFTSGVRYPCVNTVSPLIFYSLRSS